MNCEHISISRESTWHQCQQLYKFKYHLKTIVEKETPIYLTFGKAVHKIIEVYVKSQGKNEINKIISDVIDGNIPLDEGKKEKIILPYEYKTKLSSQVGNFLKFNSKIGFKGEIEWKFEFDLDPPNNKKATGFIDRLIIKDKEAFIIDYKTSKVSFWRKDHTNITKDLQLQCYCYAVMTQRNIEAKNIKAALLYLEDNKLVPVSFSEQTLNKVPKRLLQVYRDIENTDPDQVIGNVGDHCNRCDFRTQCPFYRLT